MKFVVALFVILAIPFIMELEKERCKMKKTLLILTIILSSILLVSCKKEYKGVSKVVFKERTDETLTPNVNMSKSITPLSTRRNTGWIIGDRPEIYFEYERGEEFVFVEAGLERSSDPGRIFKFREAVQNLDGYSIQTGQSYNVLTETESFRAIITVPEIENFGAEEYILISIKIRVNNTDIDIEIPDDSREVEIVSTVENHWDLIDVEMKPYGTVPQFYLVDMFYYVHFEVFNRRGSFPVRDAEIKIFREGVEVDLHHTLPGMGDATYEYFLEVNFNGTTKRYYYSVQFTDDWNSGSYAPGKRHNPYYIMKSNSAKRLDITLHDGYTAEDVILINKTLGGETINKICVIKYEAAFDKEVNIRLKGYSAFEAKRIIELTSPNLVVNVELDNNIKLKLTNK